MTDVLWEPRRQRSASRIAANREQSARKMDVQMLTRRARWESRAGDCFLWSRVDHVVVLNSVKCTTCAKSSLYCHARLRWIHEFLRIRSSLPLNGPMFSIDGKSLGYGFTLISDQLSRAHFLNFSPYSVFFSVCLIYVMLCMSAAMYLQHRSGRSETEFMM